MGVDISAMDSKTPTKLMPTHFHYETIDSTNEEALRLLKKISPPFFITANRQTAGRGRMGRKWHSPEGNLYCTAAFFASVPLNELPLFTLYAALRLCHALNKNTGGKLWLKWPNDLWVGRRKCAGLLAESPLVPQKGRVLILGVGLNVNTKEFPPEIARTATSLKKSLRKNFEVEKLRKVITQELMLAYERFIAGQHLRELMILWQQYGKLVGKRISFEENGKKHSGQVLGLSPQGALCVKTPKGIQLLQSGEVTLSKFL